MRINLSDLQEGAFAEIHDGMPWKLMKTVIRLRGQEEMTPEQNEQINTQSLNMMVREWNLKDVAGNEVPIPSKATTDQVDMIDGRIIARILNKIIEATRTVNIDPNSGTASSTS